MADEIVEQCIERLRLGGEHGLERGVGVGGGVTVERRGVEELIHGDRRLGCWVDLIA